MPIVLPEEISVPETKPATEWINGRLLKKMSPRSIHSVVQLRVGAKLLAWAEENQRGRVGTEWDFWFKPAGEPRRILVPDVAYISYARLPLGGIDLESVPRVPPEAVFEILSPGERFDDIADRIRVYLQCGVEVVVYVDPKSRTFDVYRLEGTTRLRDGDAFSDGSLPAFSLAVGETTRPD